MFISHASRRKYLLHILRNVLSYLGPEHIWIGVRQRDREGITEPSLTSVDEVLVECNLSSSGGGRNRWRAHHSHSLDFRNTSQKQCCRLL